MRALVLLAAILGVSACAAPSVHRSYEEAWFIGSEPTRGVILYLHGCDGRGGRRAWFPHLQSVGFLVIVPDSFADPRPDAACGRSWDAYKPVFRIRSAQTAYAIERIREAWPGAPLLVWGHSEGGALAYTLDDDFAGIIVTGHACGFGVDSEIKVRPNVPMLIIQGTKDPWVPVARARRTCVQLDRSLLWHLEMIEGTGHQPSFYMPEVREPIEAFLLEHAR